MRNTALAVFTGACLSFGLAQPTVAADKPLKAPVYTPPYDWSGLYVGANSGGAWSNSNLNCRRQLGPRHHRTDRRLTGRL
jgi:hypothetical protein